jgi:Skp family chaperone for outer membrane proteins
MTQAWMSVLAAAAGIGLLAAASPQAPAQDGKTPFKLGVVNLKTCFEKDKYDRIKEVDVDLQRLADEYARKLKEIEQKILEIQQKIQDIPRESALRGEKILQLRRLETDHKFEKEYGRAKYLDYYSDKKIEIYNDIRQVVADIAKEQKFDLVLRVEQPLLEEQDPETVSQRINNRVVLYHNEGVDITASVVKRLNELWAVQKAKTGGEWICPECKKKTKGDACAATPGCKGKKP